MVRRRALSLIEMMLVLATLATMLALGLVSMRRSTQATGSRGLAEVLAEELRSARSLAVSSRQPVGVLFPSGGSSRGFFLAQGRQLGRLLKGCNLGQEYGQGGFFIGNWPSTLGLFTDTEVHLGLGDDVLKLDNWLPAGHTLDQALIFLPSGRARGIHFQNVGGNYVVVAGQGFRTAGTTLQGVADAYSVVVSSLGSVAIEKGVFAAAGNLADEADPRPALVSLLPFTTLGNHPPEIRDVTVYPEGNEAVHGADEYSVSDIVVDLYPDRPGSSDNSRDFATVSLRIYATDPDGGPLRYHWSEDADKGTFSAPEGEMEWLEAEQKWSAWCDWTPPIDADINTSFRFDCQISDPEGNSVSSIASGTVIRVQPRSTGKIAFEKFSWDSGSGDTDAIYVMNIDGTAIRQLANQANVNEGAPDWSPAGDWLAFHSLGSSGQSDIMIATGDGKSRINLTNSPTVDDVYPCWSPRGDRVALYSDGNHDGLYGVVVREAQAGGDRFMIAGDQNICPLYPPSFNPTGSFLAYLKDQGTGPTELHVRRAVNSPSATIVRLGASRGAALDGYDVEYVKWNPTFPHQMLAVTWGGKLLLLDIDPTQPESDPLNSSLPDDLATKGLGFTDVWDAEWSPDGKDIAVCSASPNYDLYLVKNAWSNSRTCGRLTRGQDTMAPAFSPDGRWLVVQQWQDKVRGAPPTAEDAYKLFRRPAIFDPATDPDNSQMKLLTEDSANVSGQSVSR